MPKVEHNPGGGEDAALDAGATVDPAALGGATEKPKTPDERPPAWEGDAPGLCPFCRGGTCLGSCQD